MALARTKDGRTGQMLPVPFFRRQKGRQSQIGAISPYRVNEMIEAYHALYPLRCAV